MASYGKSAARFLAALLLLSFPAVGAYAFNFGDGMEIPGGLSGPTEVAPPPSVSSVTPSAELTGFWEKLKNGAHDSVCKKASLALEKGVKTPDGVFGLNGGIRRAVKKFPDGNLALLDEIKLNLNIVLGRQLATLPTEVGDIGLSVGLSSKLEGKSQVVRPIANKYFCSEAVEWAKFWEIQTVLPATAKRITKVQVGEIWKLPLSMSMSFSVGAGASVYEAVTISVSAGTSVESKPSVSLRRLDADHLRLRLRLDRLWVRSAGLSISTRSTSSAWRTPAPTQPICWCRACRK
jgi:hypothetical protein